MNALSAKIQVHIPMIEWLTALMYPFLECAIHDLSTGKIVALYNNISRRHIGDPSPIAELGLSIKDFPDVHEPYEKTNWDGKILKCTSITLRDKLWNSIGLICFNFDTTIFRDFGDVIQSFLAVKKDADNPVNYFEKDVHKKTHDIIYDYLKKYNLVKKSLSKSDRKKLIVHLYQIGIFNFKNATTLIAQELGISRASVYNYLK